MSARIHTYHSSHNRRRSGFTIVELITVIVIIAILAAIITISYNGVTRSAHKTAVISDVETASSEVARTALKDGRYDPCDDIGITTSKDNELYCRITPNDRGYCVSVSWQDIVYSATSTDHTPRQGSCEKWVLVPANAQLGTDAFWVMKYEAKDVDGVATSTANGLPWVSITQADAISKSATACDKCHLVSESEWMAIAADVLSVPSNWTGGAVGSGYVYQGHVNGNPASPIAASNNDASGTYGMTGGFGSTAGTNSRRTLTLTNGEVIWDIIGNTWQWTTGTVSGPQPSNGTAGNARREYTSITGWGNLEQSSRPSALAGLPGLSAITSWNSSKGIGMIWSRADTTSVGAFQRGSSYASDVEGGVLSLTLDANPTTTVSSRVGFRVAR